MSKTTKKDFAKKKAKLGKKVQKSTETKIKLRAKKIHVPTQATILKDSSQFDENETASRLVKQLHHYSESHRVQALIDVKEFLLSGTSRPEQFVTLLFPELFELLFQDDHDTRDALVNVVSYTVPKIDARAFEPVMPLLTTYLCSALAHLNKSVRRDAMLLLVALAERSPTLVQPTAEKLMRHLLLVLQDKTLPLLLHTDKSVKISMFQLTLKSITCVLVAVQDANKAQQMREREKGSAFLWSSTNSATNGVSGSVLVVRGRADAARSSRSFYAARSQLTASTRRALIERLNTVWNDIVNAHESIASEAVVNALLQLVRVLRSATCAEALLDNVSSGATSTDKERELESIRDLFSHFPFLCHEAVVGSQSRARITAELLNIEICDLSAQLLSTQTGLRDNDRQILSIIDSYLQGLLRENISREAWTENETVLAVRIVQTCADMFVRDHRLSDSANEAGNVLTLCDFLDLITKCLSRGVRATASSPPRSLLTACVRVLGQLCSNLLTHTESYATVPTTVSLLVALDAATNVVSRSQSLFSSLSTQLIAALCAALSAASSMIVELDSSSVLQQRFEDLSATIVRLSMSDRVLAAEADVQCSILDLLAFVDTSVLASHYQQLGFTFLKSTTTASAVCFPRVLSLVFHRRLDLQLSCERALELGLTLASKFFDSLSDGVGQEDRSISLNVALASDQQIRDSIADFVALSIATDDCSANIMSRILDTMDVKKSHRSLRMLYCLLAIVSRLSAVFVSEISLKMLQMQIILAIFSDKNGGSDASDDVIVKIAARYLLFKSDTDDFLAQLFDACLVSVLDSRDVDYAQLILNRVRLLLQSKVASCDSQLAVMRTQDWVLTWVTAARAQVALCQFSVSEKSLCEILLVDIMSCF